MLLVSHVLPEVEELCDRAATIVAGQVAWQGPLSELRQSGTLEESLFAMYEKGMPR